MSTAILENLPIKIFADGADLEGIVDLYRKPYIKGLTTNPTLSRKLGTRHRAAIGITEETDCLALVVSEETGWISLANAGRMVRNLGQSRLQKVLSILDRSSGYGVNGRVAAQNDAVVGVGLVV